MSRTIQPDDLAEVLIVSGHHTASSGYVLHYKEPSFSLKYLTIDCNKETSSLTKIRYGNAANRKKVNMTGTVHIILNSGVSE